MGKSTLEFDKEGAIKFNPEILKKEILQHLRLDEEKLCSCMLSAQLEYARRLLYYTIYLHTDLTFKGVQALQYTSRSKIASYVTEASHDSRVSLDISIIISRLI